jgi:hypothetical protein
MGATRNIVIRNGATKNMTEHGIREDLEHIHNLVVIFVKIDRGDIFISTNSVHNALFARTCMMSRSLYKGLKIEWYPDECAVPLPRLSEKLNIPQPQQKTKEKSNRQVSTSNLFSLLDLDETEQSDESDDGDDDDVESQALPEFPSNGVGINWADAVIVA